VTGPTPKPLSLRREGDGLRIDWADGTSTFAEWKHLRANCPCAGCLDEKSRPPDPLRVLSVREVEAGPPAPVAMTPVGHYAYQITWTDGHGAGIYTLETLRVLGTSTDSQ
jgi:DUF971 family protein